MASCHGHIQAPGLAGLDAEMVGREMISPELHAPGCHQITMRSTTSLVSLFQLLLDVHEWFPDNPMKNELEWVFWFHSWRGPEGNVQEPLGSGGQLVWTALAC